MNPKCENLKGQSLWLEQSSPAVNFLRTRNLSRGERLISQVMTWSETKRALSLQDPRTFLGSLLGMHRLQDLLKWPHKMSSRRLKRARMG